VRFYVCRFVVAEKYYTNNEPNALILLQQSKGYTQNKRSQRDLIYGGSSQRRLASTPQTSTPLLPHIHGGGDDDGGGAARGGRSRRANDGNEGERLRSSLYDYEANEQQEQQQRALQRAQYSHIELQRAATDEYRQQVLTYLGGPCRCFRAAVHGVVVTESLVQRIFTEVLSSPASLGYGQDPALAPLILSSLKAIDNAGRTVASVDALIQLLRGAYDARFAPRRRVALFLQSASCRLLYVLSGAF
jgi:hypothetical protein